MKISTFCAFSFFVSLIILSVQTISAQEKLMGEITVTNSNNTNGFVTVNGERIVSGRTIMSPADIVTSAQASAKISLPNRINILISPNTKIKLFFVKEGISGDMTAGEVVFATEPGTKLNILTADGTTTLADSNQSNVVKLSVINGSTRVNTLVGAAVFNTQTVSAGEYFPLQNDSADKTPAVAQKDKESSGGLILIAVIGAAAAAAVLGLVASGGSDDSPPVSPVR